MEGKLHDLCCIKCRDPILRHEKLTTVEKGLDKLIDYFKTIEEDMVGMLLKRQESGKVIRIHRDCQKSIYNELKRKPTLSGEEIQRKLQKLVGRRSKQAQFNWKKQCMFCEKECVSDVNHPGRVNWRRVQVLSMRDTLLKICNARNDAFSRNVEMKLLDCIDLVAAEARYHHHCRSEFKPRPSPSATPGRPLNQERMRNFDMVCSWLESEVEIHTLSDIYEKMKEIGSTGDQIYSQKWLKAKLKERYSHHIIFIEEEGKPNKVCFKDMVGFLINDAWYQDGNPNSQDEAERVIGLAAKLVLDDIRSTDFNCDWFPQAEEIESTIHTFNWLPSKLRLFLDTICKRK